MAAVPNNNMAAPLNHPNNNNNMHPIFFQRHGFPQPLINPKVLMDSSIVFVASAGGLIASSLVTDLLGNVQFCMPECMVKEIESSLEEEHVPPNLKKIKCLHSADNENPEDCLKFVFGACNAKDYIFATVDHTRLANSVYRLPLVTLRSGQPTVAAFLRPTDTQISYANSHSIQALRDLKKAGLKSLKNREKHVQAKKKKCKRSVW